MKKWSNFYFSSLFLLYIFENKCYDHPKVHTLFADVLVMQGSFSFLLCLSLIQFCIGWANTKPPHSFQFENSKWCIFYATSKNSNFVESLALSKKEAVSVETNWVWNLNLCFWWICWIRRISTFVFYFQKISKYYNKDSVSEKTSKFMTCKFIYFLFP